MEPAIQPQSLLDQLDEVTELISLPEVYLKIHALMDDTTSDIDDFAHVIRLDPNLTARVLKVVNRSGPRKLDR